MRKLSLQTGPILSSDGQTVFSGRRKHFIKYYAECQYAFNYNSLTLHITTPKT